MIYLLYGQPAAGKTVLGDMLAKNFSIRTQVDAEQFRQITNNNDYTQAGREKNIRAANAVVTYLHKVRGEHVIMTFVNPYEYLRQELKDANSGEVIDIFLTSSERKTKKHHNAEDFEIGNPMFKFDTNGEPKMNFERLLKNLAGLRFDGQNI
tara:strand:+ start:220 stop:675 length:456 start_codon:yes stop_codon:yes gene_type:complete